MQFKINYYHKGNTIFSFEKHVQFNYGDVMVNHLHSSKTKTIKCTMQKRFGEDIPYAFAMAI